MAMGNNPISKIDLDGGCVECPNNNNGGNPYTDTSGTIWTHDGEGWTGGYSTSEVVVTGSNGNNARKASRQRVYNTLNFIDIPKIFGFTPTMTANTNIYGKGSGLSYIQDTNPDDNSVWYVDSSQMTDISGGGTNLRTRRNIKGRKFNNIVSFTAESIRVGSDSYGNMDKLAPLIPMTSDTIFSITVDRGKGHSTATIYVEGELKADKVLSKQHKVYKSTKKLEYIEFRPGF